MMKPNERKIMGIKDYHHQRQPIYTYSHQRKKEKKKTSYALISFMPLF